MPTHPFPGYRGTLETISIESEALRNNLIGDPARRDVAVYLPEGYHDSAEEYLLFVDLAGYTGSGLAHLNWSAFQESLPQRIDRLVSDGKMGPVVVAFPDCFTSLGGNQYINSCAMGMWEDYLIDEMTPELERRYRLRGGREHRALFGKSSGGYGSIVHGLRNARSWGGIACHSGDIGFDLLFRGEFPRVVSRLAEFDSSVEEFLAHIAAGENVSYDDFHVLMVLAMAATYDPDPGSYKGIRLPVDLQTCELDEDRWAAWLANDPLEMVKRQECLENLRSLGGLFIDCGYRDQYHLHFGARRFNKALEAANIDHNYEEFDGTHSSINYRMDVSLPFLYNKLHR